MVLYFLRPTFVPYVTGTSRNSRDENVLRESTAMEKPHVIIVRACYVQVDNISELFLAMTREGALLLAASQLPLLLCVA